MKHKSFLLLKVLLLSTGRRNQLKHCADKKKRRRIIGGIVGSVFLYLFLMVYSISVCIGYGYYGLIENAPTMCALIISILSFVLTFLKTNGYLFNFKEYDMLMSLPFRARTIAACKFLYMYLKSLPWYLSISVAMLAGYGFFARPGIAVYLLWLVLSFFLPLIPMLAATFFGFLIAKISAGFRKTNIIQTVLSVAFVLACLSLRFVFEDMLRENKVQQTLQSVSQATDSTARFYPPVGWFTAAVTKLSVPDMLLLAGVSALLFAAVFAIVGSAYRKLNSAIRANAAAKKNRSSTQKQRSAVNAVAFKEFKRFTGSTTYMVNSGIGVILASLFALICCIFGFERIIRLFIHDAPLTVDMLQPAIPFILYFLIGMLATTACSPSLEGKNYWIIQSLPLAKKTVYQGKMLFNLYLTVPFMLFSGICLCVSTKTPLPDTLLYLVLGVVLCAFSTAWGCVCGIRHMRLDWENEVEVIKQGAAVTIYLLPNMLVAMGLTVVSVILGMHMDHKLVAGIFILIAGILALLSYRRVMVLARRSDM
ncbi:MAG: hypothetical protein IJJ41_03340 [Clostridia bacterium]|nr:hypothetical protein [Clostridia bacterium]